MRRSLLALAAAATMSLPLIAGASSHDKNAAPQEAVATAYDTKTAKVLEIDQAKRKLILEGNTGQKWEVTVGPQVKNFSNIKKGDLVVVQTTESLALTLTKKEKGEAPSAEAATIKSTAPAGQKPGMEDVEVKQISAEIVKLDIAKGMVELKGPAGNVVALKAKDPSKLEGLKKGDMIAATYTDAMAISVESAPK